MTDASEPTRSVTSRLMTTPIDAVASLCRRPSGMRVDRRSGARARRWLAAAVLVCGAIGLSMAMLDVPAIRAQLPRGAPQLWPVRIYTELGQSEYFLWPLGIATAVLLLAFAFARRDMTRGVIAAMTARTAFLFLAIGVPNIAGEALKSIVGRARPFVGGEANAFLFSRFSFEARFESFPSGHAVTAFAAAFAIASIWPRARVPLAIYAVLMAVSRVVLLAHHPSDVIAGAALGLIGAMLVRYWFAVRRLGFAITVDGAIRSMPGPSFRRLKKVAKDLFSQ